MRRTLMRIPKRPVSNKHLTTYTYTRRIKHILRYARYCRDPINQAFFVKRVNVYVIDHSDSHTEPISLKQYIYQTM